MTVHVVVLFLHLSAAIALFVGYGIEWTASSLFRRATSTEQLRAWLSVFVVSPPLAGVGLGVLLLTGGYLASLVGAMKEGWVPATLVGIFLALALGFALILPRMRRIRADLTATAPPLSAELRTELRDRVSDPVLLTAIRVRVSLAAGIVFLMTAKPAFLPGMGALAAAVIVGFLVSIPVWKS